MKKKKKLCMEQVSQITVRPSETQLEDMLQCTQDWRHPYSHIYVDGEYTQRLGLTHICGPIGEGKSIRILYLPEVKCTD